MDLVCNTIWLWSRVWTKPVIEWDAHVSWAEEYKTITSDVRHFRGAN